MTRYAFAAFTLVAALAVALPASAHSSTTYYYDSNGSYTMYTANPGTNFNPAGHYVYDSNGIARWSASGSSNSSNNGNGSNTWYDPVTGQWHTTVTYDKGWRGWSSGSNPSNGSNNHTSCISSQSAIGRIRYDGNGVAYWDGGSTTNTCR